MDKTALDDLVSAGTPAKKVKLLKMLLQGLPDDAQIFAERIDFEDDSPAYRLRIELGPVTWYIYLAAWPGLPGAKKFETVKTKPNKKLKRDFIVIEVYSWAICPKCKHEFLLDETTNRGGGRDKLPPSILSLLPDPESVGSIPQSEKQPRHRGQSHKGSHTGGNPTAASAKHEKKRSSAHDGNRGRV